MNKGHQALANAMRMQARAAMGDFSMPRIALISSYDASNQAVKVILQPVDPDNDAPESNWMPLGAIGIGNGWGVAVGPQIGDQVLVLFEHGDFNSGVIIARIFSAVQQAIPVPSGEVWAVHKTGTFMKMTNDGKLAINSNSDTNIMVNGNANVTASTSANVTAPAINLGAAGQTLLKLITSAFEALFNSHTHASSGAGVPNQQMGDSHMTSTVKAG